MPHCHSPAGMSGRSKLQRRRQLDRKRKRITLLCETRGGMISGKAKETPRKRILSNLQLTSFQSSNTYNAIGTHIDNSVTRVKLTDQVSISPGVKAILGILDKVEEAVKHTPAMDNKASRFGNLAFKSFYDIQDTVMLPVSIPWNWLSPSLHATLPYFPGDATAEVSAICLERVGVLSESDHIALVVRAFWRRVMRIFQSTYWLEPAGPHGVWGLDDYHFLPFLFGSAQLRGHKYVRPKAIHDNEVVDELANDYMYFACIEVITREKVNTGMIKMYKAEVLDKLPVMQHFLFGSIFPYEGPPPPSETGNERRHGGHVHDG
ncbi:Phosphotyrosyl phosphatase activator [Pisolithus thermaeus]|nr:Phosphotyrosyl phosphatase activator [Pisolithus thermaeus]